MEDENNIKKKIHLIIAIIATIIIIIIGIVIYINIQQKINNDRFISYIEKNNFKKDNTGVYVKSSSSQDNDTTYKAIYDNYLIFKETSTASTDFTSITTGYQKDGTIEVTYRLEGYNKNHEIGTLYQKGTYKDGQFTCEIVSNNDFKTQCPEMKEKAQEFNNEVNKILEDNNIDINYITLKDKNAN